MAAETGNDLAYRDSEASNLTSLNTGTVGTAGGGQAHDNMQPYISVSFCIALFGVFPSQN
ncbi:hypothetical protein P775_03895 [Puniceibacterium antarcticum]|uniref:Phage tail collar domain-containing protein n=2 Tax=Puniceibacterium antarcticum TaxID=1206336 RepID=A0A2G8RJ55_9RHOB|nr:hypothetical protein P775_03895 [Puniceibacterium antarcticum]